MSGHSETGEGIRLPHSIAEEEDISFPVRRTNLRQIRQQLLEHRIKPVVCSGPVMEWLCEFSAARLSNEAMGASKGPISFSSVVHVVSLCLVEEDEEKEVRLK